MEKRAWLVAGLIGLLTGCRSFFPDIPGVFYQVHLAEAPSAAVCTDLANQLAAKFALQILNTAGPVPKGQCIALMNNEGRSPRVVVSLVATVTKSEVDLEVSQYGVFNRTTPSEATREFGAQLATAIHDRFSGSDVKEIHPKYGLFAP
jgi:hypothetical protein